MRGYATVPGRDEESWDFIIVGAGSAGCALANRLSAHPANRVLLLEAGGSDAHPYSRIPAAVGFAIGNRRMNWAYPSLPDASRAGRADAWPAGRLLGGGSAINGMMFVRGNRWDYDHWAALGNDGWSFDEVLPYFKRLEDNERGADEFRGAGGPVSVSEVRVPHRLTDAFVEGMAELGVPRNADLNGESQEGVGYCQANQRRGFRHGAAQAYLKPARGRRNLRVRPGACVTRVIFDGNRARGVEYMYRGAMRVASAGRGVVLSAGAIASPKILLLSGVGPADSLRGLGIEVVMDLPGVGANLQEHPGMVVSAHVTERTLTSDRNPLRAIVQAADFVFRGHGFLTSPVGHAQAFIHTREGLAAANVQVIFGPLAYDHHDTGATRYPGRAVNIAVGLCRVASRGSVGLESADPGQAPLIDYPLLADPDDVAQLREGIRFTRKLFQTRVFGSYFLDERMPGAEIDSDEQLDRCIREESFLM
ncbi:MAG: GMC family oxidoreductase N-terminal domain-containing protein, partial [Gammaproteobacteria bacterium]|nr:GMC family oxidoreductase N-terminal domain-containing protein [Gammaproteobacteria bacterium]